MKKTVIFLLCALSSVTAGSYGKEEQCAPRDAYVYSGIGDARILIPLFADDTSSSYVCSLIYNGLTKVDKDLNVTGDLAEKWEILDDGLTIKFYLRRGIFWHDGKPFTAEDVKFTYDAILDPETGCPYISGYQDIERIEITDPCTITFRYKQPYASALLKFGMGIIPAHLFPDPREIRQSVRAHDPVGTGPYMFSRWERGQYIVLEANTRYFERVPGIKRFVYRIIPDQAVQFLELVSGGIDSMELNPYQFLYRSDTEVFKKRINKYSYLAHAYTYIGYNLNDPLFSDRRVRQALSRAINREEIIKAAYYGLAEACTGPFLKGSAYYDESVAGYGYDPEKAARLFALAGWKDADGDGILEKDGIKFSFVLCTNQGNQVREDIATIVQRQWAAAGVKAEIQVVAWAAFLDQFIDKKKFQAVLLGWSIPTDPDLFSVWHTGSIARGGLNFISYSNREVDELIEGTRREFDEDKRAGLCHRAHRLINEDAPYTFLVFPYAAPAVQKRFRGIKPAPAGIGYNFIDWYVPENEVKYKM
ncbi:MAG: peptide-binding protein [Candidatus Omnitrophota bacterium]